MVLSASRIILIVTLEIATIILVQTVHFELHVLDSILARSSTVCLLANTPSTSPNSQRCTRGSIRIYLGQSLHETSVFYSKYTLYWLKAECYYSVAKDRAITKLRSGVDRASSKVLAKATCCPEHELVTSTHAHGTQRAQFYPPDLTVRVSGNY